MCNKKVILTMAGILILLAAIVYVRSRISPLIGNYSVEKNEKKVEAKPTIIMAQLSRQKFDIFIMN